MADKIKILIAYDGINPVDRVIKDLKRAGLPETVEALIFSVAEGTPPLRTAQKIHKDMLKVISTRTKKEWARAEKTSRCASGEIQAAFPKWKVKSEVGVGSPATEIVKKARQWKSDLIVVGSHSQSRLSKLFLGSVAQTVVLKAACPVRLVRAGLKKKSAIEIVLGVDGSYDSRLAVEAVARRSWPEGSRVHLITAMDTQISSAVFVSGWAVDDWVMKEDKKEKQWVRRMSGSFEKKLRESGLGVSIVVRYGDPKSLIAGEAKRVDADCIFVGARGLNRIESIFMGSVSSAIAARANCSVEVVRRLQIKRRKTS